MMITKTRTERLAETAAWRQQGIFDPENGKYGPEPRTTFDSALLNWMMNGTGAFVLKNGLPGCQREIVIQKQAGLVDGRPTRFRLLFDISGEAHGDVSFLGLFDPEAMTLYLQNAGQNPVLSIVSFSSVEDLRRACRRGVARRLLPAACIDDFQPDDLEPEAYLQWEKLRRSIPAAAHKHFIAGDPVNAAQIEALTAFLDISGMPFTLAMEIMFLDDTKDWAGIFADTVKGTDRRLASCVATQTQAYYDHMELTPQHPANFLRKAMDSAKKSDIRYVVLEIQGSDEVIVVPAGYLLYGGSGRFAVRKWEPQSHNILRRMFPQTHGDFSVRELERITDPISGGVLAENPGYVYATGEQSVRYEAERMREKGQIR